MTAATVAVVGPGDGAGPDEVRVAEEVGALLARAGCAVVTGGLGGVMAAASRGASEAGGRVVALLPGLDAADANRWADVVVPTGLGELRNALVVRSAAVVVAVGGSWGTLSEIALARRAGTPVVSVHGWRVDGAGADGVVEADGAAEAVAVVLAALG